VSIVAPGRPNRPGDLVARAQLAAADLRRRDVDVVARLARRIDPNEAAAVGEHVEHAGGDLLVRDLVLHDLGLLLARGSGPATPPAAGPRLERLLGRDLVGLVLGCALGRSLRGVLRSSLGRVLRSSLGRVLGGPLRRSLRRVLLALVGDGGDRVVLLGDGGLAAGRSEDRPDQVVSPHRPVPLDAQLRGDLMEVGERAVRQLFPVQHRHSGAEQ
jgi:hypothetical protein